MLTRTIAALALATTFSAAAPDGFNYDESKVPQFELPPVLGPATDNASWESSRRPELLGLFRTHVYGQSPEDGYRLIFTRTNTDPDAMDGAATLKQVAVTVTTDRGSLTIDLAVFIPNKNTSPSKTFLLVCNRDPSNIDPARKTRSPFWPAEEIVARGYAAASFHNADADPDKHDGWKNGLHALFEDPDKRTKSSWGTLAAWAWGASRCLDYFGTDPDIDHGHVAVVGHSRGGKCALWAAAEDPRFAMAVSNESGCGGAALSRRRFGETVARINTSFPHWFCDNFKEFNGDEDTLPVDQHQLVSLIAPRPVYVASAAEDRWADPRGEYLSLHFASPAYALYGLETPPAEMPPVDHATVHGHQAHHVRSGKHNLLPADWHRFLDFADAVWK